MKQVLLAALGFLVLSASAVRAGEIRVLSAGAVEPALVTLADAFRRETGNAVSTTFAMAPAIRRKVGAGEQTDVVIAPPAVLEEFVKAGKVPADAQAVIGRVGVGVAVRSGAPLPDVSTPEALKQAVLHADSLVFNEASTGIYFARLLERLGIADAVKAKTTRYPDGAAVFEHLLKGTGNEIGIGAMTEITTYRKKGLHLVGPLSAEVQNYTAYAAGVMARSASPEAARAFIQYLTSPSSKAAFVAAGID